MDTERSPAILKVELTDDVPAMVLSLFVGFVHDVYVSHLFLDKVEQEGIVPPSTWVPDVEETLLMNRVSIGTPNFAEFYGVADALIETYKYMGGLVGMSALVAAPLLTMKTYWSTRESRAKAKLVELELKNAQAQGCVTESPAPVPDKDADPYIRALKSSQLLSKDELGRKRQYSESFENQAQLIRSFVRNPRIIVFSVEPKSKDCWIPATVGTTANPRFEGSAEQRRCPVPFALRAPAPPHPQRSAS